MPPGSDSPRHPLRGFLLAQFFGAFNDNAWKLIVALLAMRAVKERVGAAGPAFEAASQTQATLAFVVFTLPLVLVSLPAGALADRLSKRSVILAAKVLELVLMLAGTVPLVFLGLMGIQTAFLSPAKYRLPAHRPGGSREALRAAGPGVRGPARGAASSASPSPESRCASSTPTPSPRWRRAARG